MIVNVINQDYGDTMHNRRLTTQTPGETTETAHTADTPADPDPKPTTTETTAPAVDPAPVVARRPGDLPNAAEIDPKSIEQPVLTQQGYVVPEK
jgi:hypothetical protein